MRSTSWACHEIFSDIKFPMLLLVLLLFSFTVISADLIRRFYLKGDWLCKTENENTSLNHTCEVSNYKKLLIGHSICSNISSFDECLCMCLHDKKAIPLPVSVMMVKSNLKKILINSTLGKYRKIRLSFNFILSSHLILLVNITISSFFSVKVPCQWVSSWARLRVHLMNMHFVDYNQIRQTHLYHSRKFSPAPSRPNLTTHLVTSPHVSPINEIWQCWTCVSGIHSIIPSLMQMGASLW